MPWHFGIHASAIQLLALILADTALDGGIDGRACTLASLLFWTCSTLLLRMRGCCPWYGGLLFLRWGLLAFVLIGTPVLRPVVQQWEWLHPLLDMGESVLFVVPLMYLVTRILGLPSPFNGTPPASKG
jgi:hypothetical protein